MKLFACSFAGLLTSALVMATAALPGTCEASGTGTTFAPARATAAANSESASPASTVTIKLTPASKTATFLLGTPYYFSVTATVTGSVPSQAYVLVTDSGNAINPDISIEQENANTFDAGISALTTLTAGTHKGTITVKLCSDDACHSVLGSAGLSYTFNVNNPKPTIGSISPNAVAAGAKQFVIAVTGTKFVDHASILVNGKSKVTTVVSDTEMTATISASDIASAGTLTIGASNPAPGGGESGTKSLKISSTPPALHVINASSAGAGCGGFTLYAIGGGFYPSSVVMWNNSPRTTTVLSPTLLSARINAADVATAGTASVTVVNSPTIAASPAQTFTIDATKQPTTDAVDYLFDSGHSSVATTGCPVSPPSGALWSVDLGQMVSYPLIAKGAVYALTSLYKLYALTQSTGAIKWGPISSGMSLAYDDGKVFVAAGGWIDAYNSSTGDQLWAKSVAVSGGQFDNGLVTANGVVYAADRSTEYAVNEDSGTVEWTRAACCDTNEQPAITADGIYFDFGCDIDAYSPAGGSPLWNYSGCSKSVHGGLTTVAANGIVVGPWQTPIYGGSIFDAKTGKALIPFTALTYPPAISSQLGYFVSAGATSMSAMNPRTGKVAWTYQADTIAAPPFVINQVVFVSTYTELTALDAKTGTPLWQVQPPYGIGYGLSGDHAYGPTSAAGDGLIVVPSESTLTAYRIATN